MEKNLGNLPNFSNLPLEIQQHIAAYLDAPALGFFAQSHKQTLKNILPLLRQYQTRFPLQLTAKENSTYLAQAQQIFVCGANGDGHLGLGNNEECATFTEVEWPKERSRICQVIAGLNHTLVLTKDNRLWGCGRNGYGQLGLGDKANRSIFTAVSWPKERGRICQVIAGLNYTLVLTDDHRLWVCGDNEHGQLGLGDNEDRAAFTAVPWLAERGRIHQVIAGGGHILVLTDDNRLWVCGDNKHGQLGLGNQAKRVIFTEVEWPKERGRIHQVIAGGGHTLVLTDDNRLWVCGDNGDGQLGLGNKWENKKGRAIFTAVPWPEDRGQIQQVIAGWSYTVVLTEDNRLWVCGNNFHGQLGLGNKLGNKKGRAIFTAVPWPEDRSRIQQIVTGYGYNIVLTEDNRLWVCGLNGYGQLGLGDSKDRSTFTPVKVKALPAAMKQIFMLNNTLNQLIKLGTALTLMSSTQSNTLRTQHQPDEPEGQPPLKKMRL